MPAGKLNLSIEQGATYKKRLTWRDARKRPIDMTGYTALMHVKDKAGGTTLLILSTANGRIALSSAGVIQILLSAAETAELAFSSGVYDMKLMIGAEEVRLIEGRVTVSQAITLRAS